MDSKSILYVNWIVLADFTLHIRDPCWTLWISVHPDGFTRKLCDNPLRDKTLTKLLLIHRVVRAVSFISVVSFRWFRSSRTCRPQIAGTISQRWTHLSMICGAVGRKTTPATPEGGGGYWTPHPPSHCPAGAPSVCSNLGSGGGGRGCSTQHHPCHYTTGAPSVVIRGRSNHVSISRTDVRPGVGPFCNGQITWEDGPSPGRTVRRAYWKRPPERSLGEPACPLTGLPCD